MSRQREDKTRLEVQIHNVLFRKAEIILFDPVLQQRRYGDWSKLFNKLLADWLKTNPTDEEIRNVKAKD